MKYVCLAYEEEGAFATMSAGDWAALRRETLDYVEELKARGQLVLAEPLQSVKTASTVRVRDARVHVTDGPFAETRETLGGIILIDVADLNEAIQVASKWPSARLGSIEVRPLEPGLREDTRY
jgi:hypothetical protein